MVTINGIALLFFLFLVCYQRLLKLPSAKSTKGVPQTSSKPKMPLVPFLLFKEDMAHEVQAASPKKLGKEALHKKLVELWYDQDNGYMALYLGKHQGYMERWKMEVEEWEKEHPEEAAKDKAKKDALLGAKTARKRPRDEEES